MLQTDGNNGGSGRTAWEGLLEMEKHNYNAEEMHGGAVTFAVDVAKAFQKVQLKVVWASAVHFGFPQRILRVFCGYFEHQRKEYYGHPPRINK